LPRGGEDKKKEVGPQGAGGLQGTPGRPRNPTGRWTSKGTSVWHLGAPPPSHARSARRGLPGPGGGFSGGPHGGRGARTKREGRGDKAATHRFLWACRFFDLFRGKLPPRGGKNGCQCSSPQPKTGGSRGGPGPPACSGGGPRPKKKTPFIQGGAFEGFPLGGPTDGWGGGNSPAPKIPILFHPVRGDRGWPRWGPRVRGRGPGGADRGGGTLAGGMGAAGAGSFSSIFSHGARFRVQGISHPSGGERLSTNPGGGRKGP